MLLRRYRLELFLCNVTVRTPPPAPFIPFIHRGEVGTLEKS